MLLNPNHPQEQNAKYMNTIKAAESQIGVYGAMARQMLKLLRDEQQCKEHESSDLAVSLNSTALKLNFYFFLLLSPVLLQFLCIFSH
jgi:hypothetical protein